MNCNIIFSYFLLGGPFMYPLLLFFFMALYFIIERIIAFIQCNWNTTFHFPDTIPDKSTFKKNRFLFSVCENYTKWKHNSKKFNTIMELDCQEIICGLERNLNFLTAIATLAPITGFLGTVTGMIIAFGDITRATDVSPQLVAGGIYEALITTAAGLIITIFASFFYFIFSGIIKMYARKMENTVNSIFKFIETNGGMSNEAGKKNDN